MIIFWGAGATIMLKSALDSPERDSYPIGKSEETCLMTLR